MCNESLNYYRDESVTGFGSHFQQSRNYLWYHDEHKISNLLPLLDIGHMRIIMYLVNACYTVDSRDPLRFKFEKIKM